MLRTSKAVTVARADIRASELEDIQQGISRDIDRDELDALIMHFRALDVARHRVGQKSQLRHVRRRGGVESFAMIVDRRIRTR